MRRAVHNLVDNAVRHCPGVTAVRVAVELTATHWFYLYVVWFVPFVFAALFAAHSRTLPEPSEQREPERQAVLA